MNRLRPFVLALLLLALDLRAAPRNGNRYLIDSWQTDQGLPQNSVIAMTQSSDGYLWLATFNGLVRFDGVRFTVFNSHNTPALDSSRVIRVWEDNSGCLWIGTESTGLIRREKGVFTRLHLSDDRPSQLNAMCDGAAVGEVWLTLANGRLFHSLRGKIDEIKINWAGADIFPIAPLRGRTGELLIWTDRGMFIRKNEQFVPISPDGPKFPNNQDVVCPSVKGWWRTIDRNVAHFQNDRIDIEYKSADLPNATTACLFEDRSGALWIGTLGAGAVRIDANGHREIFGDAYSLGHAQVRAIFEDHEGNIWLGTDGAGLHRVRVGAFSVIDKAAGLGADIALAVTETDDGLAVGTNGGGLTEIDGAGAHTFQSPNGLGIQHVWTLLQDRNKTLWIGTWGAGVFKQTGTNFESVPQLNMLGGVVLASHQDPTGALWFGGPAGLARVTDKGIKHFTRADGLSNSDIRAIIDDGEGGLWLGSNGGGVNHFKDGRFTALRREQGLADESIWSLYRDKENTLWIGTFGGGLSVWRNGKLTTFTTDDGLPSGVICSITEDDLGHLWMSSYSGVFRIEKNKLLEHRPRDARKLEFFVFTKSDGLPSRECTGSFQPAVCKMRDGRLAFPTVKGVAIVDPRKLLPNPLPPRVSIEEVQIDDAPETLDPLPELVIIPPKSAQVEFRYTALSFSAPEKVRFRYQLEGLDKEWQDAGPRRSAYYSHLPPGDYRFHVIAANNDGVWNQRGSILAVRVIPAFWQTWWFFIACALLIGGGIAGSIRYVEVRKLQRRMEHLEQQHAVERERARIAKDIHDDLGASLTQITLLSELARTDLGRPAEAESHIRQISGTARELTRAMDEIVWAVNPENNTLEDLLTYTVKFAQEHLGLARIRCRLDVPANLPPLHLSAEVRHNLFLAIKEAVNNVVKHSKTTQAWLRLRASPKSFTFEIEDNGCGIPPAAIAGRASEIGSPGSHNGLRNMERRLREIGGSFEIVHPLGGGSLVRMKVNVSA